jgi:1-deoxy-D-xylulose-5-phosphate reductoisomerase
MSAQKPTNLSILGATGSIGRNTLAVVEQFPELYHVEALAGGKNIELLTQQIQKFKPKCVCVLDEKYAAQLKKNVPPNIEILYGPSGYEQVASYSNTDMVVSAIVGAAGLMPTIAAIRSGKDVALANKESLVMAGKIVMHEVNKNNVRLLPVDSEHSAIFQCLQGHQQKDLSHILLTASGGPFRNREISTFKSILPRDALNHPTWNMGQKITIDSATLMNKGLEIIEAHFLFHVPSSDIQVIVHPQSIVHSMVAYHDGSIIAQLGIPDMKGAIAYALSYPNRLPLNQPMPNFFELQSLNFFEPDLNKFPCLSLAYDACNQGKTYPAVLNAANEIAVDAFLNHQIGFMDIPRFIEKALTYHKSENEMDIACILHADQWARDLVKQWIRTNV